MKFLSLFSGVGGFDLGLERAGMECIGQVEIDPQCRKVLAHHWPDVWRAEDVRSVGVGRAADHVGGEPHDAQADPADALGGLASLGIDLICGGFPCQDLSVAGKRAGLDGARSGLWFEFHRIVSELRPAYVLVENVPGLLSSNQGRDFAVVIDGLGNLGYSVSWAVLDAQHFGVPQRRRRVFIVAGSDPGRTEAILALAEGCAGHPAAGRTPGQDVAGEAGAGVANPLGAKHGGWRGDLDNDTYVPTLITASTLDTHLGDKTGANGHGVSDVAHTLDGAQGQAVVHSLTADGFDASEDGTGQGTPLTAVGASVRRLTPVECERLMGMPDGWTDVDGMADGPRYRMLGNAVVVPVIEWIGRRIMAVEGA